MHKCLNELEFLPDPTIDYGVSALDRLKKFCFDYGLTSR